MTRINHEGDSCRRYHLRSLIGVQIRPGKYLAGTHAQRLPNDQSGSYSRRGTVILEMAIAVPIILLTSLIILIGMNCVQSDIAFAQAVDQATNEVSIAIPVIDVGLDAISSVLSDIEFEEETDQENLDSFSGFSEGLGFVTALANYVGFEGEDLVGTLVFGKAIRDRIMWTYECNCDNEVVFRSIDNVSVYVDYDRSAKIIYIEVYYQWITPFRDVDKVIRSAIPVYGDLELIIDGNDDTSEDSVWDKENFERGLYFRNLYGGNLPERFPVLSAWENGTATSIKSIDLTAPSYESGNDLYKKVIGHIDEIAEYQGTDKPWGKDQIYITGEEIENRVLIIIVPENSPESLIDELNGYRSYAESRGVEIVIKQHGVSGRYSGAEEESIGEGS
ncbi:MAG: hypothetical protein JW780_00060 [Clostridiales bacterium]|nr:hypothetical protein [Clostridiales bacterium]